MIIKQNKEVKRMFSYSYQILPEARIKLAHTLQLHTSQLPMIFFMLYSELHPLEDCTDNSYNFTEVLWTPLFCTVLYCHTIHTHKQKTKTEVNSIIHITLYQAYIIYINYNMKLTYTNWCGYKQYLSTHHFKTTFYDTKNMSEHKWIFFFKDIFTVLQNLMRERKLKALSFVRNR